MEPPGLSQTETCTSKWSIKCLRLHWQRWTSRKCKRGRPLLAPLPKSKRFRRAAVFQSCARKGPTSGSSPSNFVWNWNYGWFGGFQLIIFLYFCGDSCQKSIKNSKNRPKKSLKSWKTIPKNDSIYFFNLPHFLSPQRPGPLVYPPTGPTGGPSNPPAIQHHSSVHWVFCRLCPWCHGRFAYDCAPGIVFFFHLYHLWPMVKQFLFFFR